MARSGSGVLEKLPRRTALVLGRTNRRSTNVQPARAWQECWSEVRHETRMPVEPPTAIHVRRSLLRARPTASRLCPSSCRHVFQNHQVAEVAGQALEPVLIMTRTMPIVRAKRLLEALKHSVGLEIHTRHGRDPGSLGGLDKSVPASEDGRDDRSHGHGL